MRAPTSTDKVHKLPAMSDSLNPADGSGYKAGRRNTWFSGFGFGGLTGAKTFTDETDSFSPSGGDKPASSLASPSTTDDIMEAPPVMSNNRRRSVGAVSTKELENLQNQASGSGSPNPSLLNWLSSKRFMPSTETINEAGEELSGGVGLSGATAGGLTAPVTAGGGALGITAAAKAMVEGGGDGKRKMSFRDLNALSPSNWWKYHLVEKVRITHLATSHKNRLQVCFFLKFRDSGLSNWRWW